MPTRFDFAPEHSVAKLDLSPQYSGIFTPGIEAIDIRDDEVHRFNALAHSLNPAMPSLSSEQLIGVVRRVLRTAASGGESPFIRSRLRRAAEMRVMADDAAWSMSEQTRQRVRDLIDYIDDPRGLLPDALPVVGRLDDALLVDIAMDTLRDELDEYAEFRRYRGAEADRHGVAASDVAIDRVQWQAARQDELRLEQQLRQVRGSGYVSAAERVFRVC